MSPEYTNTVIDVKKYTQELMNKFEQKLNCNNFYIFIQLGKENKLMNEREKLANGGEDIDDELEKDTKDNTLTIFMYLSSVSFNESNELNEDTFIHRYYYQILEEIFGKTDFALVWANGESESLKESQALDGNNHERKPDF
ncbi:354_t:CDS:2 [Funneliformis caledonium]|uniref:354_t:CDS:1 n=1 Tax=Funneliformis caledonium TaxID=1117310 RepID=A0A9N8WQ88_9GLOM|nr:354_t:CDS:2 [Funneliformis caledonium]